MYVRTYHNKVCRTVSRYHRLGDQRGGLKWHRRVGKISDHFVTNFTSSVVVVDAPH